MERKIGEQFDFLGVKLEVIEGEKDSCKGCFFDDTRICGCECIANYLGYCAYSERKDKKDIIFKKVE